MREMNPRTMNRFDLPRRQDPKHCERIGCNYPTKGGKPLCNHHVEKMPYVKSLLSRIAKRKREEDKVSCNGQRAVNIESSISQEILQYISVHGECTYVRVARDMNRNISITRSYLKALISAGLLISSVNKRYSATVRAA